MTQALSPPISARPTTAASSEPPEMSIGEDVVAERGLTRRLAELIVAAVLFALAALVVSDNYRIGAGWSSSGPQAGYFPMRIGILLGVCSLAVFWQALREPSAELFATWGQLKRVSQVLLPLTAYIALISPLGIYVASTIFIAAFMIFAGKYPVWKAIVIGLAVNLLMFYVFEIQFKVPLPKGPLETWLGY